MNRRYLALQITGLIADQWRERRRGWHVCPACLVSLVPRAGVCNYCARRATSDELVYPRAGETTTQAERHARTCARLVLLVGAAELAFTLDDVARLRRRAGLAARPKT